MISLRQVGYRTSGMEILRNLDLDASECEVVGIIGPNGAGKTTLLRILAGIIEPTSGEALVAGRAPSRARHLIGYLPERHSLYPEMTVRQYVDHACRFFDFTPSRRKTLVREALAHLGLEEAAGRSLRHMTAGFLQRTALASALVHQPKVLVLDEPAKALDPGQIAALARLLKHRASQGACVVLSTHILAQVRSLAGRVLVMNAGAFAARMTISEHAFESPEAFVLTVRGDARQSLRGVTEIRGVMHADAAFDGRFTRFDVTPAGDANPREQVSAFLASSFPIVELAGFGDSLEQFYARAISGDGGSA